MSHRDSSDSLPGWLWFFLVLPLTLVVTLLYKRQRLPAVLQQQLEQQLQRVTHQPPRYLEPDSIPLNMSDMHPAAAPFAPEEAPASGIVSELPKVVETLRADAENIVIEPVAAPETGTADNLKIIEGIGPAISRLLNEQGVRSFQDLASTPVARLQAILTEARLNRLADPSSWPEQASMAAEGRWEALETLKSSLKGGRRKN